MSTWQTWGPSTPIQYATGANASAPTTAPMTAPEGGLVVSHLVIGSKNSQCSRCGWWSPNNSVSTLAAHSSTHEENR